MQPVHRPVPDMLPWPQRIQLLAGVTRLIVVVCLGVWLFQSVVGALPKIHVLFPAGTATMFAWLGEPTPRLLVERIAAVGLVCLVIDLWLALGAVIIHRLMLIGVTTTVLRIQPARPSPMHPGPTDQDGALLMQHLRTALQRLDGRFRPPWVTLAIHGTPDLPAALSVVISARGSVAAIQDAVRTLVQTQMPNALVEVIPDPLVAARACMPTGVIAWRTFRPPPPSDGAVPNDMSAFRRLLAAAHTRAGVTTEVQLMVRPGPVRPASSPPDRTGTEAPLLLTTARMVVLASDPATVQAQLDRLTDALATGTMRLWQRLDDGMRAWPCRWRGCNDVLRRAPRAPAPPRLLLPAPLWGTPGYLTTSELGAHWRLPEGLIGTLVRWLPCRWLPLDPAVIIPDVAPDGERWVTVGHARRHDGTTVPIGTTLRDLCEGLHGTSTVGGGKSRFAAALLHQVMDDGAIVIDCKGDDSGSLVATIQRYIPNQLLSRLVILDILDTAWPISLNPLVGLNRSDPTTRSQVYGQVEQFLVSLDPEGWSSAPGMRQFLQMATLLVLATESRPTLLHIKRCLTVPDYRANLLARGADPEVMTFWQETAPRLSEQQRTSLAALDRRLDLVLTVELLRALLVQPAPTFTFEQAIAERKLVLIPIPHLALGALAGTIAMLLLNAIVQAIRTRPGDARSRRPYVMVMDEIQVLLENADQRALRTMVTQFRSLGIAPIYLHQSLMQLGPLRDLFLVNAASRLILRTQEPDASIYAHQYPTVGLTAADIAGQDRDTHQYVVLMRHGRPVGPISIMPLPWPEPADQSVWIVPYAALQTIRPTDSPTPAFDAQILRLVYGTHPDPDAIAAALQDAPEADWQSLLARWEAIRQAQWQALIAYPGYILDPLERQRWVSRLAAGMPAILQRIIARRLRRSGATTPPAAALVTTPTALRLAEHAPIAGLSSTSAPPPMTVPPPVEPPDLRRSRDLVRATDALQQRTNLRNPTDSPPTVEAEASAGVPESGNPPVRISRVDLQIDLLRTLGRMEMLVGAAIRQLFFADQDPTTMRRFLQRLVDDGLVWVSDAVPLWVPRDHPPLARLFPQTGRRPYVYGLTPTGKERLIGVGDIEVDARHHRLLRARDLTEQPLSATQAPHDVQVAWHCVSILRELARHPWCTHVFVQLEYVVTPGADGQRIDAVIVFRVSRTHPRSEVGRIPYFDSSPRRDDETDIRLVLEIDRGTESAAILRKKAQTYRMLSDARAYDHLLGGPVLPVFIVPTLARAALVRAEWTSVWPEGPGLISTAVSAEHPQHGMLWGQWYALSAANDPPDGPLTPYWLTTTAQRMGDRWAMRPYCTLPAWQEALWSVPNRAAPYAPTTDTSS